MSHPHPELELPGPLADGGVRVVPLGGLGEVGRNMTVVEHRGQLLIIDCGVLFPDDHHPGIDLILPDFEYIKDRLDGFGGTGNTFVYQDLADFPKLAQRVFGDPGRSRRKTPACNAPISVRDPAAARTDADNLNAALAQVKATEGFMSAASPGVVSLFFRNDHYKDHDAYLEAIAEAMVDVPVFT